MNRRQFLIAGSSTALFVIAGIKTTSHDAIAEGLTFEVACEYAERFYALANQIPEEYRAGIDSITDLSNWTKEIVPMFEYEKIDGEGEVGDFGSLNYPEMKFEDYQDGLYSNHVLGTTDLAMDVTMSARFANPVSPWYQHPRSIMTLIHELAHAQGVMFRGDVFDAESSAQLITLEVAAAMVNKGNRLVLYSLLGELASMFNAAAHWIAIQSGDENKWVEWRDKVYTDPFEIANFDKSQRFWVDDPEKLAFILESYNFLPMQAVYEAFQDDLKIDGVRLPINWMLDSDKAWVNVGYAAGYSYSTPVASPTPFPMGEPLIVDDLAYVFDHAEEMVRELRVN